MIYREWQPPLFRAFSQLCIDEYQHDHLHLKKMRDLNQKGNDNSYAQEPNESDQHRATET